MLINYFEIKYKKDGNIPTYQHSYSQISNTSSEGGKENGEKTVFIKKESEETDSLLDYFTIDYHIHYKNELDSNLLFHVLTGEIDFYEIQIDLWKSDLP